MESAVIDGITLEYEVRGTGDPVVFIHGAFIADSFRPLFTEPGLAGRYRLIAYHRRGYGLSTRTPGPTNIARQAADCLGLMSKLGVGQAHVVGHSLGGAVALQLALDAPDAVATLGVFEPALFVGPSAESYRASLLEMARHYREGAAGVATVEQAIQARWPGYSRAALERVLPGAVGQAVADADAVFKLDIGLVDWSFGEGEARRIKQPVLVVLGGGSPALHPRFGETYRLLLEWLPKAEGFVLPGATHFLHLEDPHHRQALAGALAAFFARHPLSA